MTHSPKLAALLFAVLSTLVHAQDIGWYNGKTSPYSISTADELKGLQSLVANGTNDFDGKTILLANDIALSGNWTPIGSGSRPFKGVFDGQGHTISGLSVDVGGYAGFFDYVGANGQIKNINVVATTINGSYAGVLAGSYGSDKPIENCSAKAESVNGSPSGGLIGRAEAALTITNSYTSGNISGSISGGLVGYANATLTIANSYASGNVSGNDYSGGLVGQASAIIITNSYASGNVSNGLYSGGLVGYVGNARIENSYASGNVSTTARFINQEDTRSGTTSCPSCNATSCDGQTYYGTITYIYNYSGYSGGIVGYANGILDISNNYASGNIIMNLNASESSESSFSSGCSNRYGDKYSITIRTIRNYNYSLYSSGLVGYANNTSNITNSYASGSITENLDGTLREDISSRTRIGGIFGRYNNGTMTSVYYNSESTSQASGSGNLTSGVFAISSDNLKKKNSFLNWDFNEIWDIDEGISYPYLRFYIPLNSEFDLEVEQIPDLAYTGTQIKPEPTVRLKTGGTPLTKDTDYMLTYGANKTAGTEGTITISGLDSYYGLNETVPFNILHKTLTISEAAAQDKVYNGNTTATITGTLEGVVTGDNVSFNGTGSFEDKNIGTSKAVTAAITLTGTSASNYKLTQPTDLTANITKKPVTITLSPKTITLAKSDPITNFRNYIAYNGLVTGDNPDTTGTTGLYNTSNPPTPILTVPAIGGPYPITLSGTRTATNYEFTYDNEDLNLVVTGDPVNLSTCTAADIPAQEYTGSVIMPAISVTCGTTTLTAPDDYVVVYGGNNVNVGPTTGVVTILGRGGYTGSIGIRFAINAKALTVTGATAEDKVYDGTTAATITGAELELSGVIGTDDVSIANHTEGTFASADAGEDIEVSTSISLTGAKAGNYSVTQPSDLKASITPKALAADAIQTLAAQTYTGADITPAITVKDGSSTLASGTDYTAAFANNRNAGTATVTITGKGNYSGTATANFTINAKALTGDMIEAIPPQQYAEGNAIEPLVTVKYNTRELLEGRDYTLAYSNNTSAGTATVTITGTGNYTGTASANFLITAPKDIEDLEVAAIPDQTYTGEAITPTPVLKDGSYTLVLNTDYTISYLNNTAAGNARVIVSGTGSYSGTRQITFRIVAPALSSSSTPSSSSSSLTQPSSSSIAPSSSSSGGVPIRLPQIAASNQATLVRNGVNLQATGSVVVEVYGLDGNLVSKQSFASGVYAVSFGHLPKGMYIVKAAFGSEKKMLKVPVN